jgi:hypothetical protein
MSESRGADAAPRFNRTCPLGSVGCQVRVPHTLNSCFDSLLPQHGEQPLPPSEARTPCEFTGVRMKPCELCGERFNSPRHDEPNWRPKAEPSSLRPALRDYVQHKPGCLIGKPKLRRDSADPLSQIVGKHSCSCGLAEALQVDETESKLEGIK